MSKDQTDSLVEKEFQKVMIERRNVPYLDLRRLREEQLRSSIKRRYPEEISKMASTSITNRFSEQRHSRRLEGSLSRFYGRLSQDWDNAESPYDRSIDFGKLTSRDSYKPKRNGSPDESQFNNFTLKNPMRNTVDFKKMTARKSLRPAFNSSIYH